MIIKQIVSGLVCLALTSGLAQAGGKKSPSKKTVDDGMVLVPAGEFKMGSDREENEAWYRDANALNPFGFNDRLYVDERPAHKVTLPAYKIDKYEVTNAQYRDFLIATGHGVPYTWPRNGYNYSDQQLATWPLEALQDVATNRFRLDMDVPNMSKKDLLLEMIKVNKKRDRMPVTSVNWSDANDYCNWAKKRLPSEAEWEKAARGTEGFEYPWGNAWDAKKVNTMSEDPDAPYSEVGSFPSDVSPYGAFDMAANVSEWVADWYKAYPNAPASDIKFFGEKQRVVRGGVTSSGHYDSLSVVFRAAKRTHLLPNSALIDLGFRCVKDVK
ncbi:MAG: SUMF1/EgtB/PvdO family nonheme iron enzyme [Gallionella sp.]|nr:SUMF1/EgtB/PvdO family nonheme iron enzyme [Gallionella sp.]